LGTSAEVTVLHQISKTSGFSLKPLDSAQAKVFVEQQAATYKRIIERSKITE
jgi:hypothetical protein